MILSIISGGIIVLSVLGIARIISRHARVLASIDIESIPAERYAVVKDAIIVNRIKRRFASSVQLLSILSKPLSVLMQVLRERFNTFHTTLLKVKAEYRTRTTVGGSTITNVNNLPVYERLPLLISDADDLLKKELFKEAEHKFISVLALDAKYIPAYKGLQSVYVQQKEWEQACEVSEHVCRLLAEALKNSDEDNENSDPIRYAESLHDLSDLYCRLNRPNDALKSIRKALKIQENNPKYLDSLIEIYIALKLRLKAERALEDLKEANPENQKIQEIQQRIAVLSY